MGSHSRAGTSWMDVALLVLASLAVTFLGLSYLRPVSVAATDPGRLEGMIGETMPDVPLANGDELVFSGTNPTLALFFRTDCPFCEQNAPQWEALVAGLQPETRVIAFTMERVDLAEAWLNENQVEVHEIVVGEPGAFSDRVGVRGVPTTLVVSADGVLVDVAEGLITGPGIGGLSESMARTEGGR
jgi:thioredoxin family protein